MKILIVTGTPKLTKSSSLKIASHISKEVEKMGLTPITLNLGEYHYGGCHDCGGCRKSIRCSQDDQFTSHILPQIVDKDIRGVIYISPVYFGGVTSQLKAFFDRTVSLRRNNFFLEGVVAGAVTVGGARNGGQEFTSLDIIKYAMIQGMIVVPDASPTSHFGAALWSGKVDGDIVAGSEKFDQVENLVKSVIETTKRLNRDD